MIGRALDSNNDLIIKNNSFQLVKDGAEVVQHVRTRLLFYMEEWFLDLQAGVPYFQEIFVKPVNLANIESIFKSAILDTDGVLRLIEFSMEYLSPETRILKVTFTAETTYGVIQNEEVTINV